MKWRNYSLSYIQFYWLFCAQVNSNSSSKFIVNEVHCVLLKMSNEFEIFWKPFVRIFQAICVSHYSVFRPSLRNSWLKSLPFCIYWFLFGIGNYVLILQTTIKGYSRPSDSPPNTVGLEIKPSILMHYVNALSLYSSLATHIIFHYENILFGQHEVEICEKMKTIDDIIQTQLNHATDYKVRRTKYIRTVCIFMGCAILSISTAFSILPELYHGMFFMSPFMLTVVIVLRARWCQITLYLCMIADTLEDLHILLKQQQIDSFKESFEQNGTGFVPKRIRYIREIYANVWFITTLISDAFGWTLILFLVKVR